MKKTFITTLLLCLLTVFTSFAKEPTRSIEGLVTKISDGDTIHVTDSLGTKVKVRFYGIDCPETEKGNAILQVRKKHEQAFNEEREKWLNYIISENKEITDPQISHLKSQNKRLNLAIRLVEPFQKNAALWSLSRDEQFQELVGAVQRMKPMIDFFVRAKATGLT